MAAEASATAGDDLADVSEELRALRDEAVMPIHAEPHGAAIAGLLVSDFLQQAETADVVAMLVRAGVAPPDLRRRVDRAARAILTLVKRLGGAYLPERRVADRLNDKATSLRASMLDRMEATTPATVDVKLWVDAIRRGKGAADLVFDLRALANLFMDNLDAMADARPGVGAADPVDEIARTARRVAVMVEHSLRAGESEGDREHRWLLARAWTLFVPAYEELCRIGRFASRAHRDERRFPPLAVIVANGRAKKRAASLVPVRASRVTAAVRVAAPPAPVASAPPLAVDDDPAVELVTDPPPAHLHVEPEPEPEADAAPEPEADAEPEEADAAPPPLPAILPAPLAEAPPAPPAPPPVAELTDQAPTDDARQAARHPVEVEVAFCTSSNFYLGFTENLSEGGVFVATYCLLPIGSAIEIELHLPIGSIKVPGVVRWLRMVGASDDWPGMGVQFDGLAPGDEACIREFVAVRQPLFFEPA